MTSRFSLRQFFFVTHLWLGLASGIIVTILCLTGFLLALHPPIEQWINRDLMVREDIGDPIPADQLVEKTLKGSEVRYTAIEVPALENGAWKFREGRDNTFVDPYTGENLGLSRPFVKDLYRTVFRLHRWLLLDDEIGRPITGAATVIFLIVTISGLVLWFDKCRKNYMKGLVLRRGVGWKRFNYDAHLVMGIYTLIPVIIMAASGLFWSYNDTFKAVSFRILDGTAAPAPKPREPKKEKKEDPELFTDLPYQAIVETVNKELPYSGPFTLRFPEKGKSEIVITKTPVARFWQVPARDELELDLSGQVVKRKLYSEKTRAEKFLSVIKPIHVGTVWGNFTLVIYLVASFLATTLPLTGTIMWWNRIRAQRRSQKLLKERKARETQTSEPS